MSEDTLVMVCIGGVIVVAVIIIVLANFLSNRSHQRRAQKMKRDMDNGTYDPNKKYFGNQGGWEPDEFTDTTNAPPK
jgi:hypothetical protein